MVGTVSPGQNKARKTAAEAGDNLPQECFDPVTMEPLSDPVEINRRVYNRDTVVSMVKNGKFEDPFNRKQVDPATAKPGHYMLEAIVEHPKVVAGRDPAMPGT